MTASSVQIPARKWQENGMVDERSPRRRAPPLDEAALKALALAYAARFATTRARLLAYLARKLKERGWAGDTPPATEALADRLVALGYVDDKAYAGMKRRAMAARGLGPARVAMALTADGVAPEDRGDAPDAAAALASAIAFARRKRLGPFARVPASDPASRQRAMAAMLRAGHAASVARRVLALASAEEADGLTE
jgi:regulatory protein